MDLKINIAEDAELRKYIKTLISWAVKNIVREEITDEVKKTLTTVIEKSLNDYLIKNVLKDVITAVVTKKFKEDIWQDGVSMWYWDKEIIWMKSVVESSLKDKVTEALNKFNLWEISDLVRKEMISQISEKLSK